MNRRTTLIVGAVVLIIVVVGLVMLGRSNQTTQTELLPGTLEPSPETEQVLDGAPPAVVPAE